VKDGASPDATTVGSEDLPFGLRGLKRFGFWLAVWTFLGMLQAARLYVAYNYSSGERFISGAQAITWALADWYIWGLFSLGIFALTRRTRFGKGRWSLDLAVHLLAAPVFAASQLFVYLLAYRPLGTLFWHRVGQSHEWTLWSMYLDLASNKLHVGILIYFLLAFIYFTLYYQSRFARAEQHRAQLAAQLATAQLSALKMQLHPHFLFNTLNAITAFIHSAPETADRMTTRLGELLRTTLELEHVQEVPLRRELDFLAGYLEIQRLRFSDRLTVDIAVDPDVREARVPVLLLQPLVENAIEHGAALRAGKSTISLQALREAEDLVLRVSNHAPRSEEAARTRPSGGRGLANTRARLSELYGPQGRLEIVEDDQFRVTVRLPFRTVDGSTA
jgi:sensor histidine kinase YesM